MDRNAEYYYYATITKVVDGDTMHVCIDLGLNVSINTTVRLYGINTPELRTEEGEQAKAAVFHWLDTHAETEATEHESGPWHVVIKTIKDKKEKYGRYLAEIYAWHILGDHPMRVSPQLNSWLLGNGFAKVYE